MFTILLLSIVSFVLYFLSPKEFSLGFCWVQFILYIYLSYKLFRYTNRNYLIGFNVVFIVSFFLVTFVYPLFIYSLDETFFLIYRYYFNPDFINKGTALSVAAFSLYVLGYCVGLKKSVSHLSTVQVVTYKIKTYRFVQAIQLFVFLFVAKGQIDQLRQGLIYGDFVFDMTSSSLLRILNLVMILVVSKRYANEISGRPLNFIKYNSYTLTLIGLISIIDLISGSRQFVLGYAICLLFIYSFFVYRIKPVKALYLGIFSIVVLASVGMLRNKTDNDSWNIESLVQLREYQEGSQVNSVWNIFEDYIVNTRNIYIGLEYVDKYGVDYGTNACIQLLGVIPYVPSIVSYALFDRAPVSFSSQELLTQYTRKDLGYSRLNMEIGSNLAIDLYMSWHLLGIFVLFFLGLIISKLERIMPYSIYSFCIYLMFLSNSLFYVRSSFWGAIRTIVWGCAVMFILVKVKRLPISLTPSK